MEDGTNNGGNHGIHQVAMLFKRLARHYGAAIVLTNGTVQQHPTTTTTATSSLGWKPALEQVWQHVPDLHIWLQPLPQQQPQSDDDDDDQSNSATNNKNNSHKVIRAMLQQHPARSVSACCGVNNNFSTRADFCITPQGIRDAVPTAPMSHS
jgi:hypothetical protein